jgi:hypothetical protein
MLKIFKNTKDTGQAISHKSTLKKTDNHRQYEALAALGNYLILNPKKAQTSSP